MLKKSHIAQALGVDPANITRWAQRGMPLYSIAAAEQWRRQNIRPRIKPYQPPARPSVDRVLAAIAELATTTDTDEIAELRELLALLPAEHRPTVALAAPTWDAMLGTELLAALDAAHDPDALPLTDDEADEAGALLVAAAIARQ